MYTLPVMKYEWEFKKITAAGWTWRCISKADGSVISVSDRRFSMLHDCVQDAEQHGFEQSATPSQDAVKPASARGSLEKSC
jgi:hypothetical protein